MPRWSNAFPTAKIVDTSDDYKEGYHGGNPGGLDAVDTDLAPANIKQGVTIFGKLGTLVGGPLSEDVTGENGCTIAPGGGSGWYYMETGPPSGGDLELASKALTFNANSMAVGGAYFYGLADYSNSVKLRLYMGGVQVAESIYIPPEVDNVVTTGTRALSGLQTCKAALHGYGVEFQTGCKSGADSTSRNFSGAVSVGSIKL